MIIIIILNVYEYDFMLEYQLTCLYVVIATRVLLTNLYHEKQQATELNFYCKNEFPWPPTSMQ